MVELGPMRYPRDHRFTLHLAQNAKVKLTEFKNKSSPFHYYVQDHRTDKAALGDPEFLKRNKIPALPTVDGQPRDPEQLLDEAMAKPLHDLDYLTWKEFVAKLVILIL